MPDIQNKVTSKINQILALLVVKFLPRELINK